MEGTDEGGRGGNGCDVIPTLQWISRKKNKTSSLGPLGIDTAGLLRLCQEHQRTLLSGIYLRTLNKC